MVIIIEGPDKSGKTTLTDALIKKFPGVLVKITDRPRDASSQQKNKIKKHYRSILNMIAHSIGFRFIILDRFFPSEMVYSIKRGYDAMNDPELIQMENMLKGGEHLLVFCNPGEETITERIRKEKDDYVTEEENILMLGRYKKYYERSPLNKIEVDTNRSVDSMLKLIHDKIYEHKRHRQSERNQERLPL